MITGDDLRRLRAGTMPRRENARQRGERFARNRRARRLAERYGLDLCGESIETFRERRVADDLPF